MEGLGAFFFALHLNCYYYMERVNERCFAFVHNTLFWGAFNFLLQPLGTAVNVLFLLINEEVLSKKRSKEVVNWPDWSGPTDLTWNSRKGYDPQTAACPEVPDDCKVCVQGQDLESAEYPWESHRGRRCPVILSVRFDQHAQTGSFNGNDHVSESARVVNADFAEAYTASGGYVYYPSKYNKDICQVYDYTPARWCKGKCGSPPITDDVCWALSYSDKLDGIAGKKAHPSGIMLQVIEPDGQLGKGQHQEIAMALDCGIPVYLCQTNDVQSNGHETFHV